MFLFWNAPIFPNGIHSRQQADDRFVQNRCQLLQCWLHPVVFGAGQRHAEHAFHIQTVPWHALLYAQIVDEAEFQRQNERVSKLESNFRFRKQLFFSPHTYSDHVLANNAGVWIFAFVIQNVVQKQRIPECSAIRCECVGFAVIVKEKIKKCQTHSNLSLKDMKFSQVTLPACDTNVSGEMGENATKNS